MDRPAVEVGLHAGDDVDGDPGGQVLHQAPRQQANLRIRTYQVFVIARMHDENKIERPVVTRLPGVQRRDLCKGDHARLQLYSTR